jgi:putative NIF3 family GTP cyclohydrolase 1 type 2
MANLKEVVSTLEKMAPLSLAESWDNVGLLIEPDVKKSIECVFLTNDLTEDVLEEAQNAKANLIISYHPPLFKPFKRIILKNWKVRENVYFLFFCTYLRLKCVEESNF